MRVPNDVTSEQHSAFPTDPDPWVVTQTVLTAAGLVLQFLSFATSGDPRRSDVVERHIKAIRALEEQIEEAIDAFEKLTAIIDRDEQAPEKHFFDSPFGLRLSSMFFPKPAMGIYRERQVRAFQSITGLGIRIYSMIENHPDAATEIGTAFLAELQGSANRINELVQRQRSNREVIQECKLVIVQARRILSEFGGARTAN
jgi:hypothetical protein